MANWYDTPYPGAPMVAVRGFPRPLYPPDAAPGKVPSIAGPDVEAYKRTVSRAGRWVWQAFDQAFSNGFSHGKGPNVTDTGMAGVQRQQNIQATGWVGESTFNTLRSIVIPDGLPHAGEMAMDARAVELINAAYDRFKGKEPVPPPSPPPASKTAAQTRLDKAITQIGTKENPANSNRCLYTSWYGIVGPWCAMFATWCYETEGDSPAFVKGSRFAYVPYIVSDAQNNRYGLNITSSPIPGDLVCYDWDGSEYDHVGLFESGNSSTWKAVEGNTSTSNNSNGGEVMRRDRSRSQMTRVCFVRVAEP